MNFAYIASIQSVLVSFVNAPPSVEVSMRTIVPAVEDADPLACAISPMPDRCKDT